MVQSEVSFAYSAFFIAFAGALLLAVIVVFLVREVHALRRERDERRASIARTNKLLIDKNLELFEETLREEREVEGKEDFIGLISHQLRTPATKVRWALEALGGEMEKHKRSGPEREYFERLRQDAEHMVELVDSLVRLLSLDERIIRSAVAPFDPDAVIKTTVERLATRFGEKNINLTLELGGKGTLDAIDPDSLELIVENLVENAYEYTPVAGKVTVTTVCREGQYLCSVTDTGVGIPPEKLSSIFRKFSRSEAAVAMNEGGMGLGLYLVKNIVERHGGEVSFDSAPGQGSTFRFTLPVRRDDASLKVKGGESVLTRER